MSPHPLPHLPPFLPTAAGGSGSHPGAPGPRPDGRLDPAYLTPGTTSFADFAAAVAPGALPGVAGLHTSAALAGTVAEPAHATTIVSLVVAGGVVMAGDRRATIGNLIASRTQEKVFLADASSVVGIAGTAGLAVELVRLFQVELEHFEKIEGSALSLEGKANRLAALIRGNLGLALHGLAVVPVFAGWDGHDGRGRVFSFDVTGGRFEETDHHSVGSGAWFARGALKKLWRPDLDVDQAVRVAIEALYDAADDDAATSGPDIGRALWPTCAVVDAAGARMLTDETLAPVAADVVASRGRPELGHGGGAR